MEGWRDVEIVGWRGKDGDIGGCGDGGVEGWMDGWRDGEMERWREGGMEGCPNLELTAVWSLEPCLDLGRR